MKIAFVHEYLNQFGGAERTLQALSSIFPKAPIFTLIYDEKSTLGIFKDKDIKTSFLQNFPFSKKKHQFYPLLMPLAIEQFDFSEFDLVISISASFAKGIITKPHTKHLCYCLTPPRFLWDNSQKFADDFGYPSIIKKLIPPFITYLRIWDKNASYRVDEFAAISKFVQSRIKKYYSLESDLIYPPIDADNFKIDKNPGDYFLMVGRLVSYKKFDLAIKAFNELGLPLKIVGSGPEFSKSKKLAKKNIQFLGLVSDDELKNLYSKCRTLIFPQEEDFGLVPLEAMASGRPVIAFRGGGALETIKEGETGIFFDRQTPESLIESVKKFNPDNFDPEICRSKAKEFDLSVFKDRILKKLNV